MKLSKNQELVLWALYYNKGPSELSAAKAYKASCALERRGLITLPCGIVTDKGLGVISKLIKEDLSSIRLIYMRNLLKQ